MKMPSMLEKMMFGFIESQVLFVCHELNLFDYLNEKGKASSKEISHHLRLPASSLERLLICATSMHLLEKMDGRYKLNPALVPFLTRKSKEYCGDKFSHYWKRTYDIFRYLQQAIDENKPQWDKLDSTNITDQSLDSVYKHGIYSDETATNEFLQTMWASGYADSMELCEKYSLQHQTKLVDLGGASGSFAIAALQKNPKLHAVVMDYPQVKPYAEGKYREYNVDARALFYTGDIFNDVLPQGDVYSIGYVLSDWPDDRCVSLINKAYKQLPSDGLIIILEKFFNEDKSGPYLTSMLNLTMLLEMHGQHRNIAEYCNWLNEAGFSNVEVIYSAGEKHMMIGKKI